MSSLHDNKFNVLGVLAALGAGFCFSVVDVLFKFLSDGYPLYEVVLIRSVIGMAFLFAVIVPLEGGFQVLRSQKLGLHALRGLAVVFANLMFFSGLTLLPLADAVAISFVTPAIVTMFSVIFLKEAVGVFRWTAVLIGFLGVMVIVQPGGHSFQVAGLLPLAAAFGYATLHILTRAAGGTERGAALSFYPQIAFILVSCTVGLSFGDGRYSEQDNAALAFVFRGWIWPETSDYGIFLLLGLVGSTGGYLVGQAYRLCEAGLVAPFEYIALPLAIVWGVLVFSEWPALSVWIGSAMIIASGLFSAWRETRKKGAPTRPRPRATG
ncbi:DMT family transporter [Cochlodiniinecator piscidefendens]|uniref:DMT family transporter n=1 Tax=Cochlodiniinecator piscidefendens TaxID=2715756 RepID=UPI001409E845|nr:DMT family transporter [Cochlodiniinecator piscidefendens]